MVKKLIQQHNPGIVLLHETKLSSMDSVLIKSYGVLPTLIGHPWMLLILRGVFSFFGVNQTSPSMMLFKVIFLSLFRYCWLMVSLFGLWSSDNAYHADFWQELDDLAGLGGDNWVIGGNFNVIQWTWEKSHDRTISFSMRAFNHWITNY